MARGFGKSTDRWSLSGVVSWLRYVGDVDVLNLKLRIWLAHVVFGNPMNQRGTR